jgi:hypothetical protein
VTSGVEVIGGARAAEDVARYAAQLAPAISRKAQGLAASIEGKVRELQPVATGALAATAQVVHDGDTSASGFGVQVGEGLAYAYWIEFGGSRGRAHVPQGRSVYPTMHAAEPQFAALAAETAEQTVASYPWSTPT